MVNKCILLKKGKTIRFMVSIVSILEAMKFILVLCLALTLFIGCGEPNLDDPKVREKVLAEAIDEDSLQIRHTPSGEELLYAPNQEQPYTGWVRINQGLMHLQDGELHGIYLRWHNNQQNLGKGTYKKGSKEGLWTSWHENGQKAREGNYQNGKEEGPWILWHENGQKLNEGNYQNGKEEGLWILWHENGQKAREGNYQNGKKEGPWTLWHDYQQKPLNVTYMRDIIIQGYSVFGIFCNIFHIC